MKKVERERNGKRKEFTQLELDFKPLVIVVPGFSSWTVNAGES